MVRELVREMVRELARRLLSTASAQDVHLSFGLVPLQKHHTISDGARVGRLTWALESGARVGRLTWVLESGAAKKNYPNKVVGSGPHAIAKLARDRTNLDHEHDFIKTDFFLNDFFLNEEFRMTSRRTT